MSPEYNVVNLAQCVGIDWPEHRNEHTDGKDVVNGHNSPFRKD